MEMFREWLGAFTTLWATPFYYAAVFLVAVRLYRQTRIERKLFAVKLHSWWSELWRAVLWGAAAGAAVSFAFLFVGASLSLPALILLWIAALLLSLLRTRFLCIAYGAGVIGAVQAALSFADAAALPGFAGYLVEVLQSVHLPSLFVLVGALHLAEAALVRLTAARLATPLFFESKRGKAVGGYQLQAAWPVPLLLLVPVSAAFGVGFGGAGTDGAAASLPWPTLFDGAGGLSAGWAAVAFPVLIGYHSLSLAQTPREKVRASAWRLAGYGAAVAVLGILLEHVQAWWAAAAASLLCFGLHEWMLWLDRRQETQRPPYFVHDARGLRVLAVVPGSPAAELNIEPGYLIRKVNGVPVRSRDELYAALRRQGAFVKLEVLAREGETRLLQRAKFANEHYQLGIVLCPDEKTLYVAENVEGGLFSFLRSRQSSAGGLGAEAAQPRLSLPPAAGKPHQGETEGM